MSERPRFFDDLAGIAGGALSALAGLREETEAMIRSGIDEALRRFDLVRREELEVVRDLAAAARAESEATRQALDSMAAQVKVLEEKLALRDTPASPDHSAPS